MECYYEGDQIRFCGGSEIQDALFVNFPNITFEGIPLKNCTFKDCQEVFVHGCTLDGCRYENVSLAYAQFSNLKNCVFDTCCSNGPLLTLEAEGEIEGCTFRHITALGEGGHIIRSIYQGKEKVRPLKNCRFEDCEAESGKSVLCEYLVAVEMYKTETVDNIDHTSCHLN